MNLRNICSKHQTFFLSSKGLIKMADEKGEANELNIPQNYILNKIRKADG